MPPDTYPMRRPALALTVALLLPIWGGGSAEAASPDSPPAETGPATPFPGVAALQLPDHLTVVARLREEVAVYPAPGSDRPVRILDPTTILGTPTVVQVLSDPTAEWLEVLLPVRPNGTTGWVHRDQVMLYLVEDRIVVDLSQRRLTLYQEGKVAATFTVGTGSSSTPTPTGSFYVTDRVRLADPDSPWGPVALGLSGRSEVVTEYNGGDGIIGIHGTNRPGTIGTPSSLGCVRLENQDMIRLYDMVIIGTPVQIKP